MQFEPINFMEWIKKESKAGINLCRSGVEDCSLKNLNLNLEEFEINGKNSYGYPPLIEAIAAKYRVKKEEVVTMIGTSQAIFMICAASC